MLNRISICCISGAHLRCTCACYACVICYRHTHHVSYHLYELTIANFVTYVVQSICVEHLIFFTLSCVDIVCVIAIHLSLAQMSND